MKNNYLQKAEGDLKGRICFSVPYEDLLRLKLLTDQSNENMSAVIRLLIKSGMKAVAKKLQVKLPKTWKKKMTKVEFHEAVACRS